MDLGNVELVVMRPGLARRGVPALLGSVAPELSGEVSDAFSALLASAETALRRPVPGTSEAADALLARPRTSKTVPKADADANSGEAGLGAEVSLPADIAVQLIIPAATPLLHSLPLRMAPEDVPGRLKAAQTESARTEPVQARLVLPALAQPEPGQPNAARTELVQAGPVPAALAQPELVQPNAALGEVAPGALVQPKLVRTGLAQPRLALTELVPLESSQAGLVRPDSLPMGARGRTSAEMKLPMAATQPTRITQVESSQADGRLESILSGGHNRASASAPSRSEDAATANQLDSLPFRVVRRSLAAVASTSAPWVEPMPASLGVAEVGGPLAANAASAPMALTPARSNPHPDESSVAFVAPPSAGSGLPTLDASVRASAVVTLAPAHEPSGQIWLAERVVRQKANADSSKVMGRANTPWAGPVEAAAPIASAGAPQLLADPTPIQPPAADSPASQSGALAPVGPMQVASEVTKEASPSPAISTAVSPRRADLVRTEEGSGTGADGQVAPVYQPSALDASRPSDSRQSRGTVEDEASVGERASMQGTAPTSTAPPAERARLRHLLSQSSQLELQLDSSEWGEMDVRVSLRGGVVEAQLRTDSLLSRDLMGARLPELRDALGSHGLGVGGLGVSVGQDSAHQSQPGPHYHEGRVPRHIEAPPMLPAQAVTLVEQRHWLVDRVV